MEQKKSKQDADENNADVSQNMSIGSIGHFYNVLKGDVTNTHLNNGSSSVPDKENASAPQECKEDKDKPSSSRKKTFIL